VVDDLLKLGGGFFALSGRQICLSPDVYVMVAGSIVGRRISPNSK
jgi:hypothetical protein